MQVLLQVEFEAAANPARFEVVGVGASASGVQRRLLAGQLLLLDFVGAPVPVTNLGLEPLTYLCAYLRDACRCDRVQLVKVWAGEVFDGPVARAVSAPKSAQSTSRCCSINRALSFIGRRVADVRLVAGFDDRAVFVDLDVLESS